MVPIFKVNVDSLILATKAGNSYLIKFLLEKGIIYEDFADFPGTCAGCCFEHLNCRDCWACCDTNLVYKWNKVSENYVGEIEE